MRCAGAPSAETLTAPKTLTPAEARTIFVGLMLTVFLAALNQTSVATALPTMGRYFNDFENLPWIVTSYLLTSTAVAPLYGKLSDIHGRRTVMLASIGIFVAGSAACAAAPDMLLLILGRALQGIGGGGILPVAQAIMADAIAPRERGRYQAYMAIVWVTSGVGGPILGGVLSEHFHWSLIFWINLPLGLAAALMTHTHLKRLPRHERPHKLDILGAGLMMAAAVVLLLALTWGGTRYPWLSLPIVTLLAASGMLSAAFGWRLIRARRFVTRLRTRFHPFLAIRTLRFVTRLRTRFGPLLSRRLFLTIRTRGVVPMVLGEQRHSRQRQHYAGGGDPSSETPEGQRREWSARLAPLAAALGPPVVDRRVLPRGVNEICGAQSRMSAPPGRILGPAAPQSSNVQC
jgi:MFS family permease